MKLIYISPSIIPSRSANSVHVMKFCFALSKQIDKIVLLCKDLNNKNYTNDFSYYGVKNKSFKISKFQIKKENKYYTLMYALWSFYKIFNTSSTLIYSRNQLSNLFILLLSKKKLVIELHSPPKLFYKIIYKVFIKTSRIKKIVTISNELKKIILNDFGLIESKKIIVLHDGADYLDLNKLKKIDFKINDFKNKHIGYVGHLYKGRGIDMIIKLSSKNRMHYFHIIGGNEIDISYWKNKCKNNNVIFYGFIKPSSIPSYLYSFDILIAPYQDKVLISNGMDTSKWMSPLKLFEYMSVKKPILTSKIKVLTEIFQHKSNSYLCEPSEFNDWEKGLQYFLENPLETKNIAETAHEDFITSYTWGARAKLLISQIKN